MDDATYVRRFQAGEHAAFRGLVENHQRPALAHALAIVTDVDDARDAVQDAFIDAYAALPRFDPTRRFYPWFYVLLRNRCFKLLAKRKRHAAVALPQLLSLPGSPDDARALHGALMALSAEERELVLLKHIDGLSYAELAERLEIPAGTVMSRLYHARSKLRARLDGGVDPVPREEEP
jgi:RNA polymerase sigma-70 factor, ECF subfamily